MAGKASLVHFGSTSVVVTEVVAAQAADDNSYSGKGRTLLVFRGGGSLTVQIGYLEVLKHLGWAHGEGE